MAFFTATTLGPDSLLFRGRQAELARLLQLCRDEVSAYIVLYGGRQNGKTSLLMRLEAALNTAGTPVCRLDFQLIKSATPREAFAFLAEQIAQVLPLAADAGAVSDGPGLRRFLGQALARQELSRFVLILDEWGALPAATRETLANALRALFDARLVLPALAKLQVLFSGGVELYDLIIAEASSLHSICEPLYLTDLRRAEAVALIADGLRAPGSGTAEADAIGEAVYAYAAGHPYLTQRIGRELEHMQREGATLSPATVAAAVSQIQRGDPLLRRIRDDLREQRLEEATRRLLEAPPRFTRLDDAMARLELIGLAKPNGDYWAPRNPLLAAVFRELLGMPPAPPIQPPSPEPAPKETKKPSHKPPSPTLSPPSSAYDQQGDSPGMVFCPQCGVENPTSGRYCDQCGAELIPVADQTVIRATPPPTPTLSPPSPIRVANGRGGQGVRATWLVTIFVLLVIIITIFVLNAQRGPREQLASTATPTTAVASLATAAPATATPAPTAPLPPTAPTTVTVPPAPTPLPAWLPELVEVPAGPSRMGSADTDTLADDDEKPQHQLGLSVYWIGKTEVTNAQFRPFVEGDGYTNQAYWTEAGWAWRQENNITQPGLWNDEQWNGDNYPVVGISWFEALAYVRWLSAQTGHEFRLPTEAEWEKAARGPEGRIWPWGDEWQDGLANSEETGLKQTSLVGQYPDGASPYGALDMAGNVYEWCATEWGKGYPYQMEDEWAQAYLERDVSRVIRGGSWYYADPYVRGANRSHYLPHDRNYHIGLRVVSHAPLPGSVIPLNH